MAKKEATESTLNFWNESAESYSAGVRKELKNKNINDISWQENAVDKVIFVPEDSLPARAQPNEQVIFDGVLMRVANVIDAIGMKEIHLNLGFAKGVMA